MLCIARQHDRTSPRRDRFGVTEPRAAQIGCSAALGPSEYPRTATIRTGSATGQPLPETRGDDERSRDGQHEHDRLLPLELRLAACPLAHVHGHLVDTETCVAQAQDRSGPSARHSSTAARASAVPSRSPRICRSSDRETGGGARPPASCAAAPSRTGARRSRRTGGARTPRRSQTATDRDVADPGADAVEQPSQLARGMLPVGVDAAAGGVFAFERIAVARRDPGAKTRLTPNESTRAPCSRATSAVPRSTRRRRRARLRREAPARARRARRAGSASFHAGMKTSVSLAMPIRACRSCEPGSPAASR